MDKTNSKYAVIRISGQQFKVAEGQEILVNKLREVKNVEPEVLLLVEDGKINVGRPVLKDASVKVKVLVEIEKGEKVDVYKFKAKSRYKKHVGFRPKYTRLLIEKIG